MENKKILIVDDDEEVLTILEKKLSLEGYHIVKAVSGKEAFLKAKLYAPHLILLDIVLPDIDGADVVKLLEEDPALRKIPVLFMSGIISKNDGEEKPSVTVGGFRYTAIPKPFDYDELLLEVRKATQ